MGDSDRDICCVKTHAKVVTKENPLDFIMFCLTFLHAKLNFNFERSDCDKSNKYSDTSKSKCCSVLWITLFSFYKQETFWRRPKYLKKYSSQPHTSNAKERVLCRHCQMNVRHCCQMAQLLAEEMGFGQG